MAEIGGVAATGDGAGASGHATARHVQDRPSSDPSLPGAFALLAEMTQLFADSQDLQNALEGGLSMIVSHLGAEAGALWMLEDAVSEIVCMASAGPSSIIGLRLPVTQGIVGKCVRENACQKILDVSTDSDFARAVDEKTGFVTRSILSAPLSFGDKVLGAVQLVNKVGGSGCFDAGDIHVLQVLASSAALAIANARMAGRLVEHERVRREVELAAEIQRNLLPTPRAAPFPVFGENVPARTVSGDFFDIIALSDGRVGFCLGDVSGKGINAALLMAKTSSLYRCLAKNLDGPGAVMRMLNVEISETATRGMFVTMVTGIFDLERGTAIIANAGHEPVLRHRPDGGFDSYEADAPPIGILPDVDFPEVEIELSGASLYIFSDGLTEAKTSEGGMLGAAGLKQIIRQLRGKSLQDRIAAITLSMSDFELRDDLTILGVSGEEVSS